MIIKLPDGEVCFMCAKDKNWSNDGDLAVAYVNGLKRKLDSMYLTAGQLTARAKDMEKGLKDFTVKKISS